MRLIALALVALAVAASPALAAIDVSLDRTEASPGELVRATSSNCCFLSLYLAPARLVPTERACGANAVCAPWSVGPPRRPGWIWLGRFFPHRPSFLFRVPRVAPGLYRPVVYCPPCYRGPRGSLIAGPLLRVH